jgi:uncharacterized protein
MPITPEKKREICSKAGKKAHADGKAHEFNSDEARAAGRKGGEKVSKDTEHMRRIGRKGGLAKKKGKKNEVEDS